jgi:hypothetical protein
MFCAGGGIPVSQLTDTILQQAESCCLLKVWNAGYRCSLIYGQAADLTCSATVELPREAQTCIWTEGHAVDLNCRVVGDFVAVV